MSVIIWGRQPEPCEDGNVTKFVLYALVSVTVLMFQK